ncbi:MAG: glyoxalase superfamily protein [Rhodomicrobiaceae bacterium]
MNGSPTLPSLDELKGQAKRLRDSLARDGANVSHGRVLELLAHQHGYKDWNTLFAATGNRPASCTVDLGARVRGEYLGQPFAAEVIAVSRLGQDERYRVTLTFDEPVDVVKFASFSAFRRRVSCVVNRAGVTAERTSDGRPHLRLAL